VVSTTYGGFVSTLHHLAPPRVDLKLESFFTHAPPLNLFDKSSAMSLRFSFLT
jgi:hypothetical protein